MKCEKCGGLIGNRITRINGVTICEKCAKSMGIDMAFNSPMSRAFPILDELTNAIMASGSELDFTSSKVSCPRCGTNLRDFESNNLAGCIECYNFFNDTIVKSMLRRQGSSEYIGRKPGEKSDFMPDIEISEVENKKAEEKTEESVNKTEDQVTKSSAQPEKKDKKSIYEKLMKADLGMVPDEDLEEAMREAAAAEDYTFAAKLRDELKSRKGGNN